MNVYVDLRCLQDSNYCFRGVGLHTASLLAHCQAHLPGETRIIGFLDPELGELPKEYRGLTDETRPSATLLHPGQFAIFFQPSPMTHDPAWVAGLLQRGGTLSCSVVYDFIPLDMESRYLPTALARRAYVANLSWLRLYDLHFPISHYSARRLDEVLRPASGQTTVTGVALRAAFAAIAKGSLDTFPFGPSLSPGSYFLFVGGGDSRKNAEVVLAAHACLEQQSDTCLVIVGNYPPPQVEQLYRYHRAWGGASARLQFLHGLSDSDLAQLYRHALATICPSRIEGFSIPVIEAMACGSPVLASAIDAHRELVHQPEALFDPDDASRLTLLMKQMVADPAAREALIARQREVPNEFTEERVAGRFWRRVLDESQRRGRVQPRLPGKPRIALLTPFPPDRSGVADYTAASIREIGRHATVDVFTDVREPQVSEGVRAFHPISSWAYVCGEYDRLISVVGNSHFHTRIINLHRRHGGACLVHDNRLAELYCWWRGETEFIRMARESFGRPVSLEEVHSWFADSGRLPGIFFDEVLLKADPLLVHSRGIQAQVARQYGRRAEYLPFCCYRHFQDEELSESARAAARRRLGINDDQFVVVTFGMGSATKAGPECVWALEQLHAWGLPAHLYFVGEAGGEGTRLQQIAEELHVGPYLHLFHRWISTREYRDFLLGADFAIQLRTHFFGGLSGAVLDCISAGLPVVANEDLAEAMNGPSYVLRVPDRLSSLLIAEQIANAHEAGLNRQRHSESRSDYVREHSFDRYASQLMQILGLAA